MYLHKEMFKREIDYCFECVDEIITLFENELIGTDFYKYAVDMLQDNNQLNEELSVSDKSISQTLAEKICNHSKSCEDLKNDIIYYLFSQKVNYYKEVKNRKKEGK